MVTKLDVTDSKLVYVAWVNEDLTEGRGFEYPMAISENRTTVERLGACANVLGSAATVTERRIYKIDGRWYGPIRLETPTTADEAIEKRRLLREDVMRKAKMLGLSDAELEALR